MAKTSIVTESGKVRRVIQESALAALLREINGVILVALEADLGVVNATARFDPLVEY